MYNQFFGLAEAPFVLTPDPRYLYLSPRHQEALAHLRYGITEGGGFVQLTGEVGTGKTLLIRTLLDQLPENVNAALILYPFLSVHEFVAAICHDLGLDRPGASLKELIDTLNAYLLDNHARGRRTVLIIDEAQNLSREVLEQVRLLTNLETARDKLLQILLVGQPELQKLLEQNDLRQLAQRITARYNLTALSAAETAGYVTHRCRVAGAKTDLFSAAALRTVHRLAGGVPRLINVICDRALLGAYALGRARVSAPIVRRAAAEVDRERLARQRRPYRWAAAAVLVAAALVGAWWFAPPWPWFDVAATRVTARPAPAAPVASVSVPQPPAGPELEALLRDPANFTTEPQAAMAALLARWDLDYSRLTGADGCARAASAGLRCLEARGTWNNLRQFDLPAVLELRDRDGRRHHVLLMALAGDRATLELAGRRYEFATSALDRHWYGRFELVWPSSGVEETTLRAGAAGPVVQWLRESLARAGRPTAAGAGPFDERLDAEVRAFQREEGLVPDGVVGPLTLIRLAMHDPRLNIPRLAGN